MIVLGLLVLGKVPLVARSAVAEMLACTFGTFFAKLEGNMIALGLICSHSHKHGTVCGMTPILAAKIIVVVIAARREEESTRWQQQQETQPTDFELFFMLHGFCFFHSTP